MFERDRPASQKTKLDEFTLAMAQAIYPHSQSPEECAIKAKLYAIALLRELYQVNA